MKRIASFFMAALIGGFASVGISELTEDKSDESSRQVDKVYVQPQQSKVHFTNYRSVPEAAIDFTTAAEMSVNAVVHVTTEYARQQYSNPLHEFFFGHPAPQQNLPPRMSAGSGVIISPEGYIVTNNHVIDDAEKVLITLNNKHEYVAEVVGKDPETDIALVKIDAENLPYISYGNSDNVKVGEWVLAVGNPFNLTSTVTAGIVSAKGRSINILAGASGLSGIESFIQTDAAVNPGNSGGALVSTTGELVGINTAIKSNTGSYTGYSFAVPVNIVKKVINDLLEYGTVQRAYIGVQISNIDAALAKKKEIDRLRGVYVQGVIEDGAATKAGINVDDIITKVGDAEVRNVPELQEQIARFRPGDKINVTVIRNGKEKDFNVTLRNKFGSTEIIEKEIPETAEALGAVLESVTTEEKQKLGIENGLRIKELKQGKLLSAGLQEGYIITKVDKKKVNTPEDVLHILKDKKGGVLIEGIYPNGMTAYYGFGM